MCSNFSIVRRGSKRLMIDKKPQATLTALRTRNMETPTTCFMKTRKKGVKAQMVLPAREGRNEKENGQDQPGRRAAGAGGEGAEN